MQLRPHNKGADPGFSNKSGGGGGKIMCAGAPSAHHEREVRSPFRSGSRALEALGFSILSHAIRDLFGAF